MQTFFFSAISGQTTTAESISNSSTTSTPSTTTKILPSTTTTPIPSSTSTKPTPTTTSAPVTTEPGTKESSRKFDGASFVGGIILGAFLTVIFILVCKWWQGRNKSYHSLWVKLMSYGRLCSCWQWTMIFYWLVCHFVFFEEILWRWKCGRAFYG